MFLEIKNKHNLKSTNHRRVANHFTAMTVHSHATLQACSLSTCFQTFRRIWILLGKIHRHCINWSLNLNNTFYGVDALYLFLAELDALPCCITKQMSSGVTSQQQVSLWGMRETLGRKDGPAVWVEKSSLVSLISLPWFWWFTQLEHGWYNSQSGFLLCVACQSGCWCGRLRTEMRVCGEKERNFFSLKYTVKFWKSILWVCKKTCSVLTQPCNYEYS